MARRVYGKKFGMLDRREEAVEQCGSTDPAERLFALAPRVASLPVGAGTRLRIELRRGDPTRDWPAVPDAPMVRRQRDAEVGCHRATPKVIYTGCTLLTAVPALTRPYPARRLGMANP